MFTVYIIKSKIKQRFYVGHTNDLEKRLHYHNDGKVRSTKAYKPWQVVYTEDLEDKHLAFARERQIKSYKGGEAFKKLIKNLS